MKLVIISPFQFIYGRGIERFTYELANGLASKGYEIILYCWGVKNEVIWGEWNNEIKIRKLPRVKFYRKYFASLYYRMWICLDDPETILINFLYHGEKIIPKNRRLLYTLNTPSSLVLNRYLYISKNSGKYHNLTFIAVSNYVAQCAAKYVCGRSVYVIPNGVNTDVFVPLSLRSKNKESLRIVTIAALEERKGVQYVLDALELIQVPFEYHIYGEGKYQNKLEELVKQKELVKCVFFHGISTNLQEVLPSFDVFCLMSHGEAFALSPIEALSCGIPVVVSKHPPYDELINDSIGVMVNEKDPKELADALCLYANNDSDVVRSCREKALEYDWSVIIAKYDNLIQDLV